MARITYKPWRPNKDTQVIVDQVDAICAEYAAQGYNMTVRQIYYQFVGRGLFPEDRRWARVPGSSKWRRDPSGTKNADPNYTWLKAIIGQARMGGMLDWDYVVDRTRRLNGATHFAKPGDAILKAARSYAEDLWDTQPLRMEVWVEKEALAEVVGQAAAAHDVDYFACRGYVSHSAKWSAAQRLLDYIENGKRVVILHLGDHDPSGIDMTRNIEEDLFLMMRRDFHRNHIDELGGRTTMGAIRELMSEMVGGEDPFQVRRIGLNMDQVERYDPPPDPAKLSDSRGAEYVATYGELSWELDALEPQVIAELVTSNILVERDDIEWTSRVGKEEFNRANMVRVADRWDELVGQLPPLTASPDCPNCGAPLVGHGRECQGGEG